MKNSHIYMRIDLIATKLGENYSVAPLIMGCTPLGILAPQFEKHCLIRLKNAVPGPEGSCSFAVNEL